VALGLALVPAAWWGPERLGAGGLAPWALAVVVGAFFGLPLAAREWRLAEQGAEPTFSAGIWALADLWSLLLVGAAAAPLVHGAGVTGLVATLAAWALAGLLARTSGGWVVAGLALFVGLGAWTAAGIAVADAPPWTLLEPWWPTWRVWAPAAVLLGFLLPAAGWGQWGGAPAHAPGRRHLPFGVTGVALLVTLPFLLRRAAFYETRAGAPAADPVMIGLAAGALAAAACGVLARERLRPAALRHAAVGAIGTLWFAGPAWAAQGVWWASFALLAPTVVAGWVAWRSRGADRLVAAAAAIVALGAAVAGWPGWPSETLAAASAAALLVAAVWVAGTRVLVERSA